MKKKSSLLSSISKKTEFNRIFSSGNKFFSSNTVIRYAKNCDCSEKNIKKYNIGYIIRKNKSSVERNLVKRRVKHILRDLFKSEEAGSNGFSSLCYVISIKKFKTAPSFQDLKKEINKSFAIIIRKMKRHNDRDKTTHV